MDLVTAQLRFDIDLLARRLVALIGWLRSSSRSRLPVGLFGASAGAAAALVAATARPEDIAAVVSRGGRPDLAAHALSRVEAPTLVLLGGEDRLVSELDRRALDLLAPRSGSS